MLDNNDRQRKEWYTRRHGMDDAEIREEQRDERPQEDRRSVLSDRRSCGDRDGHNK